MEEMKIDTQGGKRGIGHAWLYHAQPGIEGTVFGLCPGQWHHLSHSSGCGAFFEGIRGKALSGTAAMNGRYWKDMRTDDRQDQADVRW